jgi:hypothetical protein
MEHLDDGKTSSAQAMAEIIIKQEATLVFEAFGPDTPFPWARAPAERYCPRRRVNIYITCAGCKYSVARRQPFPLHDRGCDANERSAGVFKSRCWWLRK